MNYFLIVQGFLCFFYYGDKSMNYFLIVQGFLCFFY